MKPQRFVARAVCLISSFLACFMFISCGGPPDGYMAVNTGSVYFIQFTEKNNQLNGHFQGIEKTSDVPPQTRTFSYTFTGTQSGNSVTLTFSVLGFSSSITGTFNGNTLILDLPQADGHLQSETFNGVSLQQYNQSVDALQKNVHQQDQQYANSQATATTLQYESQATATTLQYESQATATAVQATQAAQRNEQQAVSDANAQLSSDLSALKSDEDALSSFSETSTLNGYAQDWQSMQNDYATEQKDAQAGCGSGLSNYNQVQADANQVNADENQMRADDNQLLADENQYDVDLTPVQSDIQTVQQDWKQLQQAVASNTTGRPAPAYSSNDVNSALQTAQGIEKTAQGVWQTAQAKATHYDQEASALQKQADAFPASMNC